MNVKLWKKTSFGILVLGIVGLFGLYLVSNGHIKEYLIWRWMVTFQQPIHPVGDYHITVSKLAHQLTVYHNDEAIKTFRIAISRHGLAPRKVWEDELTPEGSYRIASMQYSSRFGPRQMLLETTDQSLADYYVQYGYPGRQRVTTWEHEHGTLNTIWEVYKFNEANPEFPIWNDILIHGAGSNSDWTWGCIALDDQDVIELFDILKHSVAGGLGVEVQIQH